MVSNIANSFICTQLKDFKHRSETLAIRSRHSSKKFQAFLISTNNSIQTSYLLGGVLVKAMDYGIVVSEFVLQSRYCVHFRAYILGKGMNPLILPAMG